MARLWKRGFSMAGSKGINWKKAIFLTTPLICGLVFLLRFTMYSKSADLQTILQNLPVEINQNKDKKMLEMFEKLSQDLLKKQDDQLKQFERDHKILEKKIHELKRPAVHATLREKLALVFEYGTTKRFPAFIWQTWPYSDSDERLDPLLQTYERNWGSKNPGFVHEIANDDSATAYIHYFYALIPEVIEAYDSLPSSILKADFFKYLVLLARGGVYADMDTNPLQPVPNWIPENVSPKEIGLIVGIENDAQNPDWRSKYIRRLQFGNWIIQAKPGHPVIREIVARITQTTLQRKVDGELKTNLRNDLNIMAWTGSGIWTDVIFTYFNDYVQSGVFSKVTWKEFHNLDVPKLVGDVLVFPKSSFNAAITPNDASNRALHFAMHDSMKTWKGAPKVAEHNS